MASGDDIFSKVNQVYKKWEKQNESQKIKKEIIVGRDKWVKKYGGNVPPPSRLRKQYRTPSVIQKVKHDGYRGHIPSLGITVSSAVVPITHKCCFKCSPQSHGQLKIHNCDPLNMCVSTPYRRLGFFQYYFNDIHNSSRLQVSEPPDLQDVVLQSPSVEAEIHKYPDFEEARSIAKQLCQTMFAQSSSFLCKLAGWVLTKIFRFSTSGIHVNKGDIEVMKQAAERKVPVLYLPLHRSHLDYIVLMWVICMSGIPSPFVAAGDNLNIPLVGTFFRNFGAFFIRRKEGPDHELYKTIMGEYLIQLLKAGSSVEFFLEGGRSRTGLVNPTKVGLLQKIAVAVKDGILGDVLICPLSITFDKVYEESLTSELRGAKKVQENLWTALWETITYPFRQHYGAIYVNFSEPFSLSEFITNSVHSVHEKDDNWSSTADIDKNGMFRLSTFMGDHILYNALETVTVNVTSLLAMLLLNSITPSSLETLEKKGCIWKSVLSTIRKPLQFRFKKSYLKPAILLLRDHIEVKQKDIMLINKPHDIDKHLMLHYYTGPLLSVTMVTSILCLNVLRTVTRNLDNKLVVSKNTLFYNSLYLYNVLRTVIRCSSPCSSDSQIISFFLDTLYGMEILIYELTAMSTVEIQRRDRSVDLFDSEKRDKTLFVNHKKIPDCIEIASAILPYIDVMLFVLGHVHLLPLSQNEFISELCLMGEDDYVMKLRSALTASRAHLSTSIDCLRNTLQILTLDGDILSVKPDYDRTGDFFHTVAFLTPYMELVHSRITV